MKVIHKTKRQLNHVKTLLLYEALHKSILLILIIPLANYAISLALKASKYSYLTLQNLLSFATSPVTILALIFILLIASICFYIEFITLYQYYDSNHDLSRMYVAHLLFPGVKQAMVMVRRKGNKLLLPFCLLSCIVYSFPLYVGMMLKQRIPSYFLNNLSQEIWLLPILFFVSFLLIYVCYLGMFTILYCSFDEVTFIQGFRLSRQTIKGNVKPIFNTLISRNIILCIVYLIAYYAIVIISGIITFFAVKDSLAAAMFLTTYDQINRYYGLAAGVFGVLMNCKIIYDLFMRYRITNGSMPDYVKAFQEKISSNGEPPQENRQQSHLRNNKYSRIVLCLSIASFLILGVSLIFKFTNSLLRQKAPLFGSYITSHRGNSSIAPENTLPAIQEAINAMSDYVEIDVQETKDGVIVLLHDSNLKRTTGVNKSIWNVTYEELKTYDAGRKSRQMYRNTPIPTLEEALLLCQNTIFMNIEIKITNHEQQLVEKVVRMLEEYEMEDQCVITSTNYGVLSRVKKANESIKTGYIMSLAYGFFYNRKYADFFSVKSNFITQDMIGLAHSYGKEIHAWTVNTVSEIQRMKQLGVDNIITDYPIQVREILYEDELTTSFVDFLRTMTQ